MWMPRLPRFLARPKTKRRSIGYSAMMCCYERAFCRLWCQCSSSHMPRSMCFFSLAWRCNRDKPNYCPAYCRDSGVDLVTTFWHSKKRSDGHAVSSTTAPASACRNACPIALWLVRSKDFKVMVVQVVTLYTYSRVGVVYVDQWIAGCTRLKP